jgi:HEAT repeat protein/beta-lactamase regulating signal transducer with metallopeptidase domain
MTIFDLVSGNVGASWISVADAVVKATLLFLAAGLASFLLRRRSAALRHMIWTLALTSVLLLPVLSIALPRWQWNLMTVEQASSFQLPAPSSPVPAAIEKIAVPQIRPAANSHEPAANGQSPINPRRSDSRSPALNATAAPARTPMSWPAILFGAWIIGALLIVSRLVAGAVAVQWMSRRTERVTDAPWLAQARSLAAELGISSRIVFLRSKGAAMPMAWGLFRPAVLMPADADDWPAERLRIVLLHELAHVKRHDCLTHMLAQLSCAVHWFNPLAWIAARHVRTERERACDDLVLAAGTRGSDYADQLIEIARVMRAGRFPAVLAGASLAMAQRSELEGRLLAILDPSVPRAGLSRLRTSAAMTIFALGLLPLASVQAWHIATPDEPQPAQAVAPQPTPAPNPQATPAPTPQASSPEAAAMSTDQQRAVRNARRAGETASTRIQSAVESTVASGVQTGVQTGVQAGVQTGVQTGVRVATSVSSSVVAAAAAKGVQTALGQLDWGSALEAAVGEHVNPEHWQNNRAPTDAQGKADPRTVAALTAALKDSDKDVRETALHALVQLRDPSVFDPLIQALSDSSPDVREQAAFGLGQLRDRRAVDPLINALKDQNADVRQQAAFALGQIRDRTAVAGLSGALKDSNDDVREQAVFALGQIRDPSSVDAIVTAVHDAKADVRQQAVFALGQIRDRRAVEPLISALKDPAADVREQAAFALGQVRDSRAVEALVIALKDSAADVRQQAAFALGQIRDPRAIDGLTAALKDASADVRQQAAFALGQLAR